MTCMSKVLLASVAACVGFVCGALVGCLIGVWAAVPMRREQGR